MRARARGGIVQGVVILGLIGTLGCSGSSGGEDEGRDASFDRTEVREDCADHDPLRRPLFGDLHIHTALSWDAWLWDIRLTQDDAYRFAQGEPIDLPPLDAQGRRTQRARLSRPLDCAAVTSPSEYLSEVRT